VWDSRVVADTGEVFIDKVELMRRDRDCVDIITMKEKE
jgi:hypothetical protein